ncbi:hypothetical protein [Gracilinema caldarium]|uniref:hypothetical protein n=1 Tax=Gracilinema caldarium TaxID=215591 RepID=UPI0026F158F3|nr:hypothetical protein [Gracilinema caldarium]
MKQIRFFGDTPLKYALLLLGLTSLALASCWHPPFNPDISASVITSQKLGTPVWEVRTRLPSYITRAYYVPSRTNYEQGLWIGYDNDRLSLSQFYYNFSKALIDHYMEITLPSDAGKKIIPSIGAPSVFFMSFSLLDKWLIYNTNNYFVSSLEYPGFLGTGFRYETDTMDILFIAQLVSDQIKLYKYGVAGYVSSFDFGELNTYLILPPELPFTVTLAVPTSSGALYLSGTKSDGSAVTWFWPGLSDTPYILPIDKPLTGVLSDGRLIADSGDRLYVYSPDGSSSFVISTGALHFSYERYDSAQSRWISVFTRTVETPVPHSTDSDYLISIYEIPTSRLSELAR